MAYTSPTAGHKRPCFRQSMGDAMVAPLRIVENSRDTMDRSKALDAALSQIERAFGKGSIMRLGRDGKVVEIATISTGSIGLDMAPRRGRAPPWAGVGIHAA